MTDIKREIKLLGRIFSFMKETNKMYHQPKQLIHEVLKVKNHFY